MVGLKLFRLHHAIVGLCGVRKEWGSPGDGRRPDGHLDHRNSLLRRRANGDAQPASATTPGSDSDALYGYTFAYVHIRYTLPGTHMFIRLGVMRALGDGGYTRIRTLPGTHTSIRPGVTRALGDGGYTRIRTEVMYWSEDYIAT